MKEGGRDNSIREVGRHLFIRYKQSQANARTRVPPDRKKREVTKNRKRTRIKESLPLSANPLGLGITWGTYDAERSIDERDCRPQCRHLCINARPYHLAVRKCFEW